MRDLLDTDTYCKIKKDPTQAQEAKFTKRMKALEKDGELPTALYHRIKPTSAKIYCLPKIHKKDIPLRPIVASIVSPSYGVSKHIAQLIAPLAGHTPSFVKDSREFKRFVMSESICESETMVSFDVSSLHQCTC